MRSAGVAAVALIVSAQAILGQAAADRLVGVYDLATGAPIADVHIALLSTGLEWRTSAAGMAALRNLPSGDHILRLRRIGYEPHSEFVSLSPRDTVPLTLVLKALPVILPEVIVNAREEQYARKLSGFLSRRKGGAGPSSSFITEDDLRKWGAIRWSDAFRRTSGIQSDVWGNIRVRGCGRFALLLDGLVLSNNDLDVIPIASVAAIEIYRGAAQIPAEFNATGRACGAVVVWTK